MKETKTFIQWLQYLKIKKLTLIYPGGYLNKEENNDIVFHQYSNIPEYNNKSFVVDKIKDQRIKFKNDNWVYKDVSTNHRFGRALYCNNCYKWIIECKCLNNM